MTTSKKLIEIALPLDAINKSSAREKSIRNEHPSTLHRWWARRPLAAARAVFFAQMTPDSPLRPNVFRLAIVLLYTTGMRRREVLRQTIADYDPLEGTLIIRTTKFHKSRLVPLSPDGTREIKNDNMNSSILIPNANLCFSDHYH